MSLALERLGGWAGRHRWSVLVAWLLVALAAVGVGRVVGASWTEAMRVPGTSSQRASDLLRARFPAYAGSSATIVFDAAGGSVRGPQARVAIEATLRRTRALPHVLAVSDPLARRSGAVSRDGSIAYARVRYDVDERAVGGDALRLLEQAAEPARAAGLQSEFGGPVVQAVSPASRAATGSSELIGLAAAGVILVLAFGSLAAAALPLVTALFGVGSGVAVVGLLSHALELPAEARTVATMIGIGVSIDYALLVFARYRQNLAAGLDAQAAVARASATAGQAVVFAGGTVMIAILGLAAIGIPFLTGLGLATALVVLFAVAAAITLLPALLGFRRRDARQRASSSPPSFASGGRGWSRWAAHVAARPWRYALASLALLLALAAPALELRLGLLDSGTRPRSATERRAYDLLAAGFGAGFNGPLTLVAGLPHPNDRAALARLTAAVRSDPGVAAVGPATLSASGETAVVSVVARSAPRDAATSQLVHRLRDRVLPAATAGSGASATIAGQTPRFVDFADRIESRLLLFVGAVVALSFLLVTLAFRSLLIPLTAALMNLLSIGAAYGVVTAVFQRGYGNNLVGVAETLPIPPWVPALMFAVLFGLSMDYEVFLLSRIREHYQQNGDNLAAVAGGLAGTARVISSAALVMIAVFLSFVLNPNPAVKMLGLGLAAAILVDAAVVRVALVPAVMALLGRANWWLPGWLARLLPRLDEPPDHTAPASSHDTAPTPQPQPLGATDE